MTAAARSRTTAAAAAPAGPNACAPSESGPAQTPGGPDGSSDRTHSFEPRQRGARRECLHRARVRAFGGRGVCAPVPDARAASSAADDALSQGDGAGRSPAARRSGLVQSIVRRYPLRCLAGAGPRETAGSYLLLAGAGPPEPSASRARTCCGAAEQDCAALGERVLGAGAGRGRGVGQRRGRV